MNKVILIGRLGSDPEVKDFSDGGKIVNISLATSERWKGKDGNRQESTDWHRVAFSGKTAEIVQEYCRKGDMVAIVGKVKYRTYEQDGQTKHLTEVRATGIEFLGKSGANTQQHENAPQSANNNPF